MPATQGYRLADWHEGPFLNGVHELERSVDERVFILDDPNDIATCLLESDEQVNTYRWILTDQQIEDLALESAKEIIGNRKKLFLERQHEIRFAAAKTRRDSSEYSGGLAVVVSLVHNERTGEAHFTERHVEPSRINA